MTEQDSAIPASWDWRKQGAVTAVKNQEECGSSPYYAAVASIEGCHFIGTGILIHFQRSTQIFFFSRQIGFFVRTTNCRLFYSTRK